MEDKKGAFQGNRPSWKNGQLLFGGAREVLANAIGLMSNALLIELTAIGADRRKYA